MFHATAGEFTATITWADGTTMLANVVPGTVAAPDFGGFDVDTSADYTAHLLPVGEFTVSIADTDGATATAHSAYLPVSLSNTTGVLNVDFQINFDPSLLMLTGAVPAGQAAANGWSVTTSTTLIDAHHATFTVTASGTHPLSGGASDIVDLLASIPTNAPYGASQLLQITKITGSNGILNEGGIGVITDEAVQKVAYLGDATGNHSVDGLDASLIARAAIGLDNGFTAYPLTDPRIIGDVTGDGTLSGLDAQEVAAFGVGLPEADVPAVPSGIAITNSSIDPTIVIPTAVVGDRGQSVTLPVSISDSAAGVLAADLNMTYVGNAMTASSSDVTIASDMPPGWSEVTNARTPGLLRVSEYSNSDPLGAGPVQLLNLQFHVGANTPAGLYPVQLITQQTGSVPPSELNEGQLQLSTTNLGSVRVPIDVTINNAPASDPEGTPIPTLSASYAGDSNSVTYDWHVTDNIGQTVTDGTGSTFSFTPSDPGSFSVTLTIADASDPSDIYGSSTISFPVTDVTPSLSASASTNVSSVEEGGVGSQSVTYTYTVTNTSPATTDPVTISAIGDGSGDLLADLKAANGGSDTIAYGHHVTFMVTETVPTNNVGTIYTNPLSVSGADDETDPASASASTAISYTDVTPSLSASASTNVSSVEEGGVGSQSVTYTYTVTNTSSASTDPVTISAIGDNSGSLLAAFEAANGGSATIADGQHVTFMVTETVPTQNAGTTYTNHLSVSGADDETDPASASASAAISYTDVTPSLSASASTNVSSVEEGDVGSQSVTYTYTVTNTSTASTDPVTISTIGDNSGSVLAAFKTANGGSATIADGQHVTFMVTETVPTQNAGTTYTNHLSVSGARTTKPTRPSALGRDQLHRRDAVALGERLDERVERGRGRRRQPVGDLHLHGDQHQFGQHRPGDGQCDRRQLRQPADRLQSGQRRQRHDRRRPARDLHGHGDRPDAERGDDLHQPSERQRRGRRDRPGQRQRLGRDQLHRRDAEHRRNEDAERQQRGRRRRRQSAGDVYLRRDQHERRQH